MKDSVVGKGGIPVATVVKQRFEAEALEEIERSLHGKLRARRLSEDFIGRCAEEAIQKAVVEYLRAIEQGCEVRNRDAFIVDVAFKRAIDELRREARRADGTAVETILETGKIASPATEELALGLLRVDELREAIATLSAEQRQVLSLHYFESRSAAESAQLLHLSESSFRRRLHKTLRVLRRRLGVELPERDSLPAIEIGLAAWASIGGARVAVGSGALEQASAALMSARDFLARAIGGGDGERVTVVLGGPAGKVIGGCAGAAAACVLGGVVGPGIGGLGADPDQPPPKAPTQAKEVVRAKSDPGPSPSPAPSVPTAPSSGQESGSSQTGRNDPRATRKAAAQKAEERQLAAQASGPARVANETEASPSVGEASGEAVEPESVIVVPAEESATPTQAASEEAQADAQFGGFR